MAVLQDTIGQALGFDSELSCSEVAPCSSLFDPMTELFAPLPRSKVGRSKLEGRLRMSVTCANTFAGLSCLAHPSGVHTWLSLHLSTP